MDPRVVSILFHIKKIPQVSTDPRGWFKVIPLSISTVPYQTAQGYLEAQKTPLLLKET